MALDLSATPKWPAVYPSARGWQTTAGRLAGWAGRRLAPVGFPQLQPMRSRSRIRNQYTEAAWQYYMILDEALSRIAMADMAQITGIAAV